MGVAVTRGTEVKLSRPSDTEDTGDISRDRPIFDVTSESPTWLVDISSDSVMLKSESLETTLPNISSDVNLVSSDVNC